MADNLATSSSAALAASLAICVAASIEFPTREVGSALLAVTGASSAVFVFLDLGRATDASWGVFGSATMVAVLFEFFLVGVAAGAAGSAAAAAIKKVRTNKFIIIEHLRVVEVSGFVWTKTKNNTPGVFK